LGSKGSAVVDLQKRLQSTGFYKGKADGFFGSKTVDAVKQLQQRLKLVSDGIVGPKTWAALEANPSIQQVGFFAVRGNPVMGIAALGLHMAANVVSTFEIRSSQGPVVKAGTTVEYSVHQVLTTVISSTSRYRFVWSVENDPAAVSKGLQATLQGPRDSRTWKLTASKSGVHRIKVSVMLESSTSESSLLEDLVFEQTVTEDGRSLLHTEIIKAASIPTVDKNVKEWTTIDILRWKTPKVGDPKYIHEFKAQWVRGYREVLKAAAKRFDIPDLLMGGVAYAEVGGDPLWIDGVAYAVRSFDHSADPILEPLTITKPPDETSFGNISIQVRRAAEALGYDPNKLTGEQQSMLVSSLKNSRENIFIAAKHLADLRDVDFRGKGAASMVQEDIQVTATRFNRGPDLSLDSIKKNMSYGRSILKRAAQISGLLK
jgi:hypothetical protein